MMARLTSSPPSVSPTAAITAARRAIPRRAAPRRAPSAGTCFPVDSARPIPASTAKRAAARPENVSPIHVGVRSAFDSNVGSRWVAIMPRRASPRAASIPRSRSAADELRGALEGFAVAREVMSRSSHRMPGTGSQVPAVPSTETPGTLPRRPCVRIYVRIILAACRPHHSHSHPQPLRRGKDRTGPAAPLTVRRRPRDL